MANSDDIAILSTAAYFDLFQFPLTPGEAHRFLFTPSRSSYSAVLNMLESGTLPVRRTSGYVYARGSELSIKDRLRRYGCAHAKFRRAVRFARLLSRLPFVRMIGVCNSLAYCNARRESDIDLFVIARRNGTWLARLFVVALLSLMRVRPGQRGYENTICTSFFVDEDHCDLSSFSLDAKDVYLPQWAASMYPIYDAGGYYDRFWSANSSLLANISNAYPVVPHPHLYASHRPFVRLLFEFLLFPFSGFSEWIQRKKFTHTIKQLLNHDTCVCVREGVLKFHTNDRRHLFSKEHAERLNSLLRYV